MLLVDAKSPTRGFSFDPDARHGALDLGPSLSDLYGALSRKESTTSDASTGAGKADDQPRPVATLTLVHHPDASFLGQTRPIGVTSVELGRESTFWNEGSFEHRLVSRRHVRLTSEGFSLRVEDLASRNGTYLNGVRVTVAHAQPGDIVEMGPILMLYHLAPLGTRRVTSERIVGQSAAMARVLEDIERIAPHATTTLILGETGTGKELIAREIHEVSARRGAFIAANCGSLADNLLQGELFGYERGAFSGAVTSHKGYFESAHEGTLLLDEIGDGSPALQTSLLRVLQERELRRLGSTKAIPVDVRTVAATHRELRGLVAMGGFREDLYARLSQWVIRVPPLRERREDIPLLARAMLRRLGEKRPFHPKAMLAMLRADFPRNVRQLEAAVERMVRSASSTDAELRLTTETAALLSEADATRSAPPGRVPPSDPTPVESQRPRAVAALKSDPVKLQRLLAEHGGNVTHLARDLGVGRNTVYRWLKENDVSLTSVREPGEDDDR